MIEGAWCGLVKSLATEMRAGGGLGRFVRRVESCPGPRVLYANLDDYGHLHTWGVQYPKLHVYQQEARWRWNSLAAQDADDHLPFLIILLLVYDFVSR
jgi:hypothetical protein